MSVSDFPVAAFVLVAYLLAIFSPLALAIYLALRGGSSVPRRGTFIFSSTAMAYGALLFGWILITIPIRLFAAYLFPVLVRADPSRSRWESEWILPLYRIGEPIQYVTPIFLLLFACIVVLRLWRRWPSIAKALA